MNTNGIFSSKTDDWETPQYLFDRLNEIFTFNLDACADEKNHKVPFYFTKEDDALCKSWGGVQNVVQSTVWQTDRSVGSESRRDCQRQSFSRGYASSGKDRNKMVSRIHCKQSKSAHGIYPWTVAVWQVKTECSVWKHDRGICMKGYDNEKQ